MTDMPFNDMPFNDMPFNDMPFNDMPFDAAAWRAACAPALGLAIDPAWQSEVDRNLTLLARAAALVAGAPEAAREAEPAPLYLPEPRT